MRRFVPTVVAAVSLFASPWVFAQGSTIYNGVFEHDSPAFFGEPAVELSDGAIYNRQDYSRLATWMDVIWSEDQGYPPEIGRQWRVEQIRLDDDGGREVLGTMTWEVRSDPAGINDFCIWLTIDTEESNGEPRQLFCDNEPTSAALVSSFISQCIDETPHAMRASIISAGGSAEAIEKSQTPTSFRPGTPNVSLSPETIEPRLPQGNAQDSETDTEFVAVVEDNLDCDRPLDDAEVTVSATIVEESGGHIHFEDADEPGSGRFIEGEQFGDIEIDDDGKAATIVGSFDDEGSYGVRYQASDLGVKDRLTAIASRELEVPGGIGVAEAVSEELTIAIEELVDFSDGLWEDIPTPTAGSGRGSPPHPEYGFALAYGGSCPHQPPAVWVTPETRAAIIELNAAYSEQFDAGLSFNDASLQFGGKIEDLREGGRDASCHQLHRTGIHIDVNSVDLASTNLWNTEDENGRSRYENLSILAKERDLALDDGSHGIHFQWVPGLSGGS